MTRDFWDDIGDPIAKDFIKLFCGKKIGAGSARVVYECSIDESLVIKIEENGGSSQNVKEWEVWQEMQYHKDMKKWFAPCVYISPCGIVLVQKKVTPAYKKHYPKRVPKCLGDLKYQNFGMMDGRFVCFDYGTFLASNGVNPGTKKAEWWEGD